jgi:hypothetical protein
LVTGQVATTNPCPSGYAEQCPVIISGVYGDSTLYYAVTSLFVQQSMGTFARDSILFLNGCAFLPATRFWNALAAKGAGVLISWDNDSRAYDDYLNGAAFFNQMVSGASVSSSIATLKANGFGVSVWNGVTSNLGYLGDGSITLDRARQGQTTPPTATPSSTPRPTATATPKPPTATVTFVPPPPTHTPTSEPTVAPPTVALGHATVKPGEQQTVAIHWEPGSHAQVQVVFPNGPQLSQAGTLDGSGTLTISYTQRANAIRRHNRTATVEASLQGPAGRTAHSSAQYRVGYGKLDLATSRIAAGKRQKVTVWVHSHARSHMTVTVKAPGAHSRTFTFTTDKKGWATFTYNLDRSLQAGQKVSVRGSVKVKGRLYTSSFKASVV